MRRWCFFLLFPLLLTACAGGQYKIPGKEYRAKVRVLGVVPLLVDARPTVDRPHWDQVVRLLRRQNVGREKALVRLLRRDSGYFDVRAVPGDPEQLCSALVAGSSLAGKGADRHRRYRFNPTAVAELARKNMVDGLLVIVLNGVGRPESYWGRAHLNYLKANYNLIEAYAAVVLPSATVAWDYAGPSDGGFLPLQYPDFDEAYFNRTDEVRIKNISLVGLKRTLTRPGKSLSGQSAFPQAYRRLFEEIATAFKPRLFNLF